MIRNFEDEDLILVEIASTVVGIQLLNFQREEDEKNIRRRTAVPWRSIPFPIQNFVPYQLF